MQVGQVRLRQRFRREGVWAFGGFGTWAVLWKPPCTSPPTCPFQISGLEPLTLPLPAQAPTVSLPLLSFCPAASMAMMSSFPPVSYCSTWTDHFQASCGNHSAFKEIFKRGFFCPKRTSQAVRKSRHNQRNWQTSSTDRHTAGSVSLSDGRRLRYLSLTVWWGRLVTLRPFNTPYLTLLTSLSCSASQQRGGWNTHPAERWAPSSRGQREAQEGRQGQDDCYWSRSS